MYSEKGLAARLIVIQIRGAKIVPFLPGIRAVGHTRRVLLQNRHYNIFTFYSRICEISHAPDQPLDSIHLPIVGAVLRRRVRAFLSPGPGACHPIAALQPGERVLLVGVDTGADLPLLPEGVQAVVFDKFLPDGAYRVKLLKRAG